MMRKHEVIEGVVTMIERRHRETSSESCTRVVWILFK